MSLVAEIKRKTFHQLALIYLIICAILPRWLSVWVLFLAVLIVGAVEFLRIRRPEINARLLALAGNIHRPLEVLSPSGVWWTTLGCWLTVLIFQNKEIVLPAIGFLVFGDTAAALVGKKWGKTPWPKYPTKTKEGSYAFAGVSIIWAIFFLRWPVAILGGIAGAWIELLPLRWNDNFWLPILSGLVLSVLNLVLGRHR